jgi:hypothetical protein
VKLKDQVKAEIKNKLNLHLLRVAHWPSNVQPVTSPTSLPWFQNKRLHFNFRKAELYRLQRVTFLLPPLKCQLQEAATNVIVAHAGLNEHQTYPKPKYPRIRSVTGSGH